MSSTSTDSLASILSKPPEEKWMFTEDQLQNTPSRRDNVPPAKELNYRQQAANLIQDMGQLLPVNQLTINTAIVYMHRFYVFHSFQAFSRFVMAPTALFLAAKVEKQPRKLEHVICVCHLCLHPDKPHPDVHSDSYLKQAQQLVEHEIILLQTLGFDISIDHPHTHVVKCTQLVKASRDLSQMANFMATNSLHLTTFCLKYKPTVVSAMCIHLSCKWSNYEIPLSSEGKAYWTYMDPSITEALLENIINEFLKILNLCPTRLRKLRNYKPSSRDGSGGSTPQSKDGQQSKPSTSKVPTSNRTASAQPATDSIARRPGSNQHPSESVKVWVRQNPGMYWASYGVFLVLYFILICVESVRRRHPHNLIMLGLFTLALSYMTGTIASYYQTRSVMIALGVTVVVCVTVILFSMQTRFDFTKCSGVLFVLCIVLFLFGFITIFTYSRPWYLQVVYGCLGALVFTLFLAFDTQLVMGGKKHELEPEEYVYGALTLYIDVVYIFLFILAIFGGSNN